MSNIARVPVYKEFSRTVNRRAAFLFSNYIDDMSDNEKRKNKFRSSKKWKDFREYLRKKQKTDPVTGSKLTRRATVHHLDLDINNYEKVSDERQVMLNPETHSVLHYFYGNEKNMHDWRDRIAKIVELCERMDKLNKGIKHNDEQETDN